MIPSLFVLLIFKDTVFLKSYDTCLEANAKPGFRIDLKRKEKNLNGVAFLRQTKQACTVALENVLT